MTDDRDPDRAVTGAPNGTAGDRGPALPLLGICAVAMLVPVTLPVPVLRGLVQERFNVSVFWTSAFMSINMVGAMLAAPLAGALADRIGRRKEIIVAALVCDGACFAGLTLDLPFAAFLAIRFVEGCAHITALSLLLSLAAALGKARGSGRVMGMVGAGMTFGVALGAGLGGVLGQHDPVRPIRIGAVLCLALAALCAVMLADVRGRGERPRLGEILRLARRDTALLVPLAYAFVDRFTVGFFTTTFTLWMKEVYELTPARIGMLLTLFLGPFSLLSYPFGRLCERASRALLLAGGSLVYGVLVTSLGLWPVELLPVAMLALGVAAAVMFVPSLIVTTDLASRAVRSTALGAFNAAGSLGFIVGPLVGGAVSQAVATHGGWHLGYSMAFVVAGVAEMACVLATLGPLRRLVRAGRTT